MKKNAKYGLIIVTIIILAVVISLVYLKNNPSNNVEPVISEEPVTQNVTEQPVVPEVSAPIATSSVALTEAQVLAQAQKLAVDAPVVVSTPVPATATPVYTKTIKVEYMSNTEKTKLGIPTEIKVQVLARNAEGTVLGYKIIRQDSDIITKFGN